MCKCWNHNAQCTDYEYCLKETENIRIKQNVDIYINTTLSDLQDHYNTRFNLYDDYSEDIPTTQPTTSNTTEPNQHNITNVSNNDTSMDVAQSTSRQQTIYNNNKPTTENIFPSTETIHSTNTNTLPSTTITPETTTHSKPTKSDTHTSICPRTTNTTDKPCTTNNESTMGTHSIHTTNKYFQQNNKTIDNTDNNTNTTSRTNQDIHSREDTDEPMELLHIPHNTPPQRHTTTTTNRNTNTQNGSPNTTTMDTTLKRNGNTNTYKGSSKQSTTNKCKRKLTFDTTATTTEPTGDTTQDYTTESLYTFIIHDQYINNKQWKHPKHRQKQNIPSFQCVDHGDHIHCIISISNTSNLSRTISRIIDYFNCTLQGFTEVYNSLQRIKWIKRFIAYLLRKGITNLYRYGTKHIECIDKLLTKYKPDIDTDETDNSTHCEQYVDEKKNLTPKHLFQTNRANTVEQLLSYIEEYNITSYIDYIKKIPIDIQLQLMKQGGTQLKSLINNICEIITTKQKQQLKQTHFFEFLENTDKPNYKNISYLENILNHNNIDIPQFLTDIILILSMAITKINTFVLQGNTNTGKSMFLNLILHNYKYTTITREGDRSNFHLDQLPKASTIVFEEPIIDNTNVGTWKLLMEGAQIMTDMKHANKEYVDRIPIFITTNYDLWHYTDSLEQEPIKQRIITYYLKQQITSAQQKGVIPLSESLITPHDFQNLVLLNLPTIMTNINTIIATLPPNPTYINYKTKLTEEQLKTLMSMHFRLHQDRCQPTEDHTQTPPPSPPRKKQKRTQQEWHPWDKQLTT